MPLPFGEDSSEVMDLGFEGRGAGLPAPGLGLEASADLAAQRELVSELGEGSLRFRVGCGGDGFDLPGNVGHDVRISSCDPPDDGRGSGRTE